MEKIEFLMQNMIKMSRLETGILQIHKEDQNLYETIRHAVADVVPEAALKGINLYVNCEENMMIRHDSKWTEEVIYNILDNALKYTESGGKIRIQAERQDYFLKSVFLILEKGLHRKGRQKSLQDFTVSQRFMINQELESDYILREQS